MFGRALQLARLIPRFGVRHVFAVIQYRHRTKSRQFEILLPPRAVVKPRPLWQGSTSLEPLEVSPTLRQHILTRGDAICNGIFRQFSTKPIEEGETPEWFKGVYVASSTQHFSRVPINTVAGEDVKLSWDLSRMQWVTQLALAASVSEGEARATYLARMDYLTIDWLNENGYQRGVNWACAHEVSVRGIQLMLASILLRQHVGPRPSSQLLDMLCQSWHRVHTTYAYGRAQQNNHSFIELIFLIYAAAFLREHGIKIARPDTIGKFQLELPKMLGSLVFADGGSCMYATNYTRVFCDMLAYAKLLDEALNVGLFVQPIFHHKAAVMVRFLAAIIEPISGRMPLIGHNDGSLHCVQFSEFQQAMPSLLLLGAVFGVPLPARTKRAVDDVFLFGYRPEFMAEKTLPSVREQWFDDFGLAIFDQPSYRAYLKYPRNRFRPSQQDFLHLDLWVKGENILCDSGTFSYNARTISGDDTFGKPAAHNVPTILDAPVLSKVSPFLYAYWPNTAYKKIKNSHRFTVRCEDGITLTRRVEFETNRIVVEDRVTGGENWGVVMNGPLDEAKEMMVIKLSEAATARFTNIEHIAISNAMRAENYQSLVPSHRLVVQPMDAGKPIVTTIECVA